MLRHEDILEPFQSELVEIDGLPVIVPILGVQFGEMALKLHWWNSTVLTFGNDALNHVEYKADGVKKGIRFGDDMLAGFMAMEYPTYFRPLPDDSTLAWYAQIQMAELDIDLGNL